MTNLSISSAVCTIALLGLAIVSIVICSMVRVRHQVIIFFVDSHIKFMNFTEWIIRCKKFFLVDVLTVN